LLLEDIDVEPESRKKWMLEKFRQSNDSFMSAEKFQVWQTSSNAVCVDLNEIGQIKSQIHHIHYSPVRDRIVILPEDYLYSSAGDYSGIKGLVNVQLLTEKEELDFLSRHLFSYRHIH